MTMKLLLINPPYLTSSPPALSYGEPLGLAYISAAIIDDGRHNVDILDAIGLQHGICEAVDGERYRVGISDESIFHSMAERQFDAIGITIAKMYTEDYSLDDFIARVKQRYPDLPIIVGGPEATLEWHSYVRNDNIDYVVIGEGEKTIVELLDALSGSGELHQVRGIAFRSETGEAIKTDSRPPLDIDAIPWPARQLLPMENYFRYRPGKYYMRTPATTILTSRACPFECAFCNLEGIWGRKWRGRSADDVVDEIEFLVKHYNVREFLIQDSNFLVNRKRAEAICDEIVRRKLDIRVQIQPGLFMSLLSETLLNKLKKAGLYALCAQVETGNSRTMKYIDKKIDYRHARDIIRHANRIGLWTQSNIIIGFHFETRKDIEESIRVAESLHIDHVSYVPLYVYKGTKVYDDYLREGLISSDVVFANPVDSHHLSSEEILRLQRRANRDHYLIRIMQLLNPVTFCREIVNKVSSFEQMSLICKRLLT